MNYLSRSRFSKLNLPRKIKFSLLQCLMYFIICCQDLFEEMERQNLDDDFVVTFLVNNWVNCYRVPVLSLVGFAKPFEYKEPINFSYYFWFVFMIKHFSNLPVLFKYWYQLYRDLKLLLSETEFSCLEGPVKLLNSTLVPLLSPLLFILPHENMFTFFSSTFVFALFLLLAPWVGWECFDFDGVTKRSVKSMVGKSLVTLETISRVVWVE